MIVTIQSPVEDSENRRNEGALTSNEPIRSERALMPQPSGNGFLAPFVKALATCCVCGFLRRQYRKNPDYPACCEPFVRRSLQGKKSPVRRFLGVLRAKRDKLLKSKKSSEITLRLNSYE
jgi:hypothetical protein